MSGGYPGSAPQRRQDSALTVSNLLCLRHFLARWVVQEGSRGMRSGGGLGKIAHELQSMLRMAGP